MPHNLTPQRIEVAHFRAENDASIPRGKQVPSKHNQSPTHEGHLRMGFIFEKTDQPLSCVLLILRKRASFSRIF